MDNPTIQTDLGQVLNKLDGKFDSLEEKFDKKFDSLEEKFDKKFDKIELKIDKLGEKIDKLEIDQTEIKGEIKALETKTEQLNIRVGNVEFAVRGVLIGLAVIVLGGFAMFFWMSSKL
jgi:chromosome segregation ATPase